MHLSSKGFGKFLVYPWPTSWQFCLHFTRVCICLLMVHLYGQVRLQILEWTYFHQLSFKNIQNRTSLEILLTNFHSILVRRKGIHPPLTGADLELVFSTSFHLSHEKVEPCGDFASSKTFCHEMYKNHDTMG